MLVMSDPRISSSATVPVDPEAPSSIHYPIHPRGRHRFALRGAYRPAASFPRNGSELTVLETGFRQAFAVQAAGRFVFSAGLLQVLDTPQPRALLDALIRELGWILLRSYSTLSSWANWVGASP